MALTYDQINSITEELYLPKFPQLFADRNLILKRLHAKGTKPQGGDLIKQPVFYQNSKGGFFQDYDTFDVSAEEQVSAAYWTWRYLEVPITLARSDVLRNAGPQQIKSLMDAKVKGAAIRASQLLATALFDPTANDSSTGINGLDNLCESSAGALNTNDSGYTGGTTYGGISKATSGGYTWWGGNVYDGNQAGMTYDMLNAAQRLVMDGDIRPTIWIMGPESFGEYLVDQQAQQRYMKQSEVDAGFVTAMFDGKPVIQDRYCPDTQASDTSRCYGLNEDFLDLVTHADENMRFEPFAKPVDQAVIVGHIMWAGNLTSSDPSRHVVIPAVS